MTKILLCGDGNGAHVFTALATQSCYAEVNVLSLYEPVRTKWQAALKDGATLEVVDETKNESKTYIRGNPVMVTDDAKAAAKGAKILVFMNPAFTHNSYLRALEPYVEEGMVIFTIPCQPGFEFAMKKAWGDKMKLVDNVMFDTLPWACRMSDIGKTVRIHGTKDTMYGGVSDKSKAKPHVLEAISVVQKSLGKFPELIVNRPTLGVLLSITGVQIHPGLMYGQWGKWDGKPVDDVPRFYYDATKDGASYCERVSDEVLGISKKITELFPDVNLGYMGGIKQWYLNTYGPEIGDTTSLYTIIRSNKPYAEFKHPVKQVEDGKFVPDFSVRYLTQDIPFGMVPIRGIAEILNYPTPMMDEIITWGQKIMGKEYLVNGKLVGKDMNETSAPQTCNISKIEDVVHI